MTSQRSITNCLVGVSKLPPQDRALLNKLVPRRIRHSRNSVVFRQAERFNHLLVVEEGQSFTCRYLDDGSRQIIDIHFPGDIIGLDGLSQNEHRSELVAMTDSSFLLYDKADVVDLFAWSPALSRLLFDVVSQGQAILTERMVDMVRHSALQRVAAFLLEFQHRAYHGYRTNTPWGSPPAERQPGSSNVFRIPHPIIADSLGVSIVHVSRVLAQLRERGLIGSCGHAITVLDPDGLRLVADWRSDHLRLRAPRLSA
jgi:CRP/FNR family transcriptional regulator